jgi:UDP-N-acetylglucosamine 2-epimerase (non-hydrolysing)
VHPRTRKRIEDLGFGARVAALAGLRLCEPLGYLEFLGLTADAKLVITDSGGLQEETTALGISCLTLRANTERPVTVSEGTNTLVGVEPRRIVSEAMRVLSGQGKAGRIPALWDGGASERIAEVLRTWKRA